MGSSSRSLKDATKALQSHFTGSKIPLSLPSESRRMLQAFIDEHDGSIDYDEAAKANQELKHFWDRHVGTSSQKLGAFVGVLKELRPAIVDDEDLLEWYHLAGKPVICAAAYKKAALEDAHEFVTSVLVYDEDDDNAKQRQRNSVRICNDLLGIYIARTRGIGEHDEFVAPDNAQIAKQVEGVLVAYGKKMPKHLFNSLDDLIVREDTRLQGLTLLSTFLQHQAPHLYLADQTPLVDNLLKCLMNDTSTTILSVALKSLIMLLPHIPHTPGSRLPRLFLIYSRLLCWEKFSPLSTEAQKNLVTDDRISADDDGDFGDVGIDPTWEKSRPKDGVVEPATPEIMTYFTYLYGLYPLNFMSYIRKPRRFLKSVDFPGADDFDLDQAVIRSRSDQFRQVHLLHPNFYNLTVEEELSDPKWPKMDPADVVAECHGLAMNTKPALLSPGPPPTSRLPDLPPLPPIPSNNGSVSPAISHTSFRSGHSWRDTQSTAVGGFDAESPVLGPVEDKQEQVRPSTAPGRSAMSPMLDDFPMPAGPYFSTPSAKDLKEPQNNMEFLQQKVTALQNDLSFERWHKAQYSQHIGQLMRKNVKDATVEAETLNLINANRALKQQLEQVRSAREATIKDSNLTRKQASNLETNMTERFNKMKKEQETWAADADELKRLRAEMKHYRDLLSTAEARELNKSHEVEMMKRDMEQLQKLQARLKEAQTRLREYEYREFDFEQAKREQELLQSEKETLLMRLQRQEQDRDRTKKMFTDRIAELEAQRELTTPHDRRPPTTLSMDNHTTHQALLDSQAKLAQLKKAHSRLLERFTDLQMEYQSCKNQLESLRGYGGDASRNSSVGGYSDRTPDAMSGGLGYRGGVIESVYDVASEYGAPSESNFTSVSQSDPTSRRFQDRNNLPVSPISPPRSEATFNSSAGLTWKPPSTVHSGRSYNSSVTPSGYNPTAPLSTDERSVVSGQSGGSGGDKSGKPKIAVNSEVRVFGRGGAQNIKMKPKDKEREQAKPEPKKGGLKGLKGFAGL
ncbi:hypothetical protein M409DRAFT_58036 [Zasmidium cellare ATCC 36951]|uniref:Hamartin n=1 Tax=Zasmidium cellare ATCC 36951 TaxID=1080233 RepID=A0A6A6C6G3_ZASCE|nr:uncharacterized protein M409DRAFT_58036 [Zasmidium cellare ATCC 36951]KAF2162615.1 hypothetical protein M409DRAFT_58036 [Zasmidium cellare ATCC 36951]